MKLALVVVSGVSHHLDNVSKPSFGVLDATPSITLQSADGGVVVFGVTFHIALGTASLCPQQ